MNEFVLVLVLIVHYADALVNFSHQQLVYDMIWSLPFNAICGQKEA